MTITNTNYIINSVTGSDNVKYSTRFLLHPVKTDPLLRVLKTTAPATILLLLFYDDFRARWVLKKACLYLLIFILP